MNVQASASGLTSGNKAISIIAGNIASAEALGKKPLDYRFHVTEAGNSISTGNFSPGTVSASAVQNNEVMGVIQDGTIPTHMCFDSAKGYFVVTGNVDNPGSDIRYTRAGDFAPDQFGNLRNSAGFYLLGIELDASEQIPAGKNEKVIDDLSIVNITRVGGSATTTSNIELRANLKANTATGTEFKIGSEAIGSQGVKHNVDIIFTKTAVDNRWNLTLTSADAVAVTQGSGANAGAAYTNVQVDFDANGYLVSFNGVPAETTAPSVVVDWTGGEANSTITLDFGTAGTTDALRIAGESSSVTTNQGNGRSFATVESTFISTAGEVLSVFRNSNKQKTFEIMVANFDAPNFLEPQTGNTFTQTNESGTYVLSKANEAGTAKILSGKLEGNPTNLASELTSLIRLQQYTISQTHPIKTFDRTMEALNRIT